MAQKENSSNSEGTCKKFYKKLSFSTTSHPKPQLDQKIPTEIDHSAASTSSHKHKNVTFFLPRMLSNRNEQRSTKKHTAKREAVVANDQNNEKKAAKSASRHEHVHVGNDVSMEKTKSSLKDEGKFSDYIRKVKNKMRTSVSNVGAGKRTATIRRDSFNDKVSGYINRAKIKIRTTTNVGVDKDVAFK